MALTRMKCTRFILFMFICIRSSIKKYFFEKSNHKNCQQKSPRLVVTKMFLLYIMKITSLGVNQILYFGFDPNLLLYGIDF